MLPLFVETSWDRIGIVRCDRLPNDDMFPPHTTECHCAIWDLEESNIMSFEGKVSVVTGSALGIGEAIAIALAVKGSDVVGLDIRAPENLAVAERVRTIGRRASAIYCDVADRESVRSAAHRIGEEFGRVDILINNAGIFEMTPIADMDFDRMIDSYDRQFGVNAKGTFLVTAALLPLFSSSEGGDIVNVITNHVHKDRYPIYPGTSVYDGSKWAQLCLTEVWAEELKGRGIRVKGICPAATVTPMFRDTHAEPYTGAMDAGDVALAVTNILEQGPDAAVGTSPLVVTRADAEALAVG